MALIGKAVAEAPAVAADRIGVEGSRDFILYQRQVIAHAVADGYSSVIAAMQMNAAAATVLAFMREPILRLVTLRDSVEDFEPGIKSMGFSPFFRYILLCTFLFCTILLVIDTFSFFNLPVLLLKILTDASITVICILCAEAIRRKK